MIRNLPPMRSRLWRRLDAMPPQTAEDRVKELCAVAQRGGELMGVSTVVPDRLPQLGYRFALFRCLIDPAFRQQFGAQT
jgi:hypothetical protein